ncbi:hypothetical protein NC651_034099 [Populus alba x Populus x berolinensis]|nr:hypothetical protein NC651_034099 [Populus alba x Populus x berolinensis]
MYRSLSKTPRQKLIAAKPVKVCVNMEKLRNKGTTMERKDQRRLRNRNQSGVKRRQSQTTKTFLVANLDLNSNEGHADDNDTSNVLKLETIINNCSQLVF